MIPWNIIWLSSFNGYPAISGSLPNYVFEVHDAPHKAVWFVLVWCMLCIWQFITMCCAMVLLWVRICWLCIWFLVGVLLFQTRTLSVCKVHQFWFKVWRGNPEERNDGTDMKKNTAVVATTTRQRDVDLRILNMCLLATFILESIPNR